MNPNLEWLSRFMYNNVNENKKNSLDDLRQFINNISPINNDDLRQFINNTNSSQILLYKEEGSTIELWPQYNICSKAIINIDYTNPKFNEEYKLIIINQN
jgi:hypothetical protein